MAPRAGAGRLTYSRRRLKEAERRECERECSITLHLKPETLINRRERARDRERKREGERERERQREREKERGRER